MPRSALPQDYILNSGSIMEDFENVEDWAAFGDGSLTANTTQYRTGTQSLKFSVTTPGSWFLARTNSYSPAKDLRTSRLFHLWFYCHDADPATTINSLVITLTSVTDNSKYFTWSIGSSEMRSGWNHYVIDKDTWTVTGGETWEALIRFMIRLNPKSGQTPSVSFDEARINMEQIPSVVLAFDDARDSAMTGCNYMITKGLKATIYVPSSLVDAEGYLTSANLATLYNAGFALANHTHSHWSSPFLVGHTQTEIESELTQCQDWLDVRGYTRASRYVAYPGGAYDDNVLAAMSATDMLTGRLTSAMIQHAPLDNAYLLRSKDIGNSSTSLAYAKAWLDLGINRQGITIIHFHQLGEEAGSGTWVTSDFQAFIDYFIERRIDCLTIDEMYQKLTNLRYTSSPPSRATR